MWCSASTNCTNRQLQPAAYNQAVCATSPMPELAPVTTQYCPDMLLVGSICGTVKSKVWALCAALFAVMPVLQQFGFDSNGDKHQSPEQGLQSVRHVCECYSCTSNRPCNMSERYCKSQCRPVGCARVVRTLHVNLTCGHSDDIASSCK